MKEIKADIEENITKISVIGLGMRTQSGCSKIFEIFAIILNLNKLQLQKLEYHIR